jgi:hypothetical protein
MHPEPRLNGIANHAQQREFESVLGLLEHWQQWHTKVHLGIFHEFYMVRFEGWIVAHKPGYLFQPETGAANVVFFVDANRPSKISNVEGRTMLTLGEISSGGNALVFTENVDELIAFAMHLRPSA